MSRKIKTPILLIVVSPEKRNNPRLVAITKNPNRSAIPVSFVG